MRSSAGGRIRLSLCVNYSLFQDASTSTSVTVTGYAALYPVLFLPLTGPLFSRQSHFAALQEELRKLRPPPDLEAVLEPDQPSAAASTSVPTPAAAAAPGGSSGQEKPTVGLSPSGRPTGLNAIQDLAEEAVASAAGVIEKVKCAAAAAASAATSGETSTSSVATSTAAVSAAASTQTNGEETAAVSR